MEGAISGLLDMLQHQYRCGLAVTLEDDVPASKSVNVLLDILSHLPVWCSLSLAHMSNIILVLSSRHTTAHALSSWSFFDQTPCSHLFSFSLAFTQIGHQLRKGMCVVLSSSFSCVVGSPGSRATFTRAFSPNSLGVHPMTQFQNIALLLVFGCRLLPLSRPCCACMWSFYRSRSSRLPTKTLWAFGLDVAPVHLECSFRLLPSTKSPLQCSVNALSRVHWQPNVSPIRDRGGLIIFTRDATYS